MLSYPYGGIVVLDVTKLIVSNSQLGYSKFASHITGSNTSRDKISSGVFQKRTNLIEIIKLNEVNSVQHILGDNNSS